MNPMQTQIRVMRHLPSSNKNEADTSTKIPEQNPGSITTTTTTTTTKLSSSHQSIHNPLHRQQD